jgi:dynein heavy chain, axonemal
MGEEYIKPPLFNLAESFKKSDPFKPLIFVLSPGADPRAEI